MKHLFRHWRTSGAVIGSLLKKGSIAVLALLVVFLAGRIYESQRGPALHRWHTWSGNEMSAEEIDQATFAQYLAREKTIFADLQREVTEALPEEDKTPVNRFYRHSRVWPADMYSLSHVAVPFPLSDSLYGREPDEKNRYGISLGTISLRGETGTLSVGLETLMRVTSNPFFPWMMTRVDERIACGEQAAVAACLKAQTRVEALKQGQVQNGTQQDADDRRGSHEAEQADKP
ncbi:hypothetical protein [Klebsiella pneumoniae]|uniref:hypothetical protein n=1 Tax=Klebsiella pneumoniae TaxID=573 RepID=UPI003F5739F8